ncbi:hypothetical protein CFP56_011838 [Quercus suber]
MERKLRFKLVTGRR